MPIKQQGGVFGRNPTFNDLNVEGVLDLGTQQINGSDYSVEGSFSVALSNNDGGVFSISKGGGFPTELQLNDTVNYTSGNASSYDQAISFYADALNRYSGSGAVLQAMGQIKAVYDVTSFSADSDQGAGQLILRARENTSNSAIDNLKDHLIIHGKGGDVEIGIGNLKVPSGKGIDFSATSGTGTSELFDDYEEGTWTPTTDGDATGALSAAEGIYTKIGRLVFIEAVFTVSTNFTSQFVGGLPFTVGNYVTASGFGQSATAFLSASDVVTGVAIEAGTRLGFYNDNNSSSVHPPNTTNGTYRISMCYQA